MKPDSVTGVVLHGLTATWTADASLGLSPAGRPGWIGISVFNGLDRVVVYLKAQDFLEAATRIVALCGEPQ